MLQDKWSVSQFLGDERFTSVAAALQQFTDFSRWPQIDDYNAAFHHPVLSFVGQEPLGQRRRRRLRKLQQAEALEETDHYDGQITMRHRIPTRPESWHDFFNMTVWLSFPQSKLLLHQKAFAAAQRHRAEVGVKNRSPLQDKTTIFDEGGLAVFVPKQHLEQVRSLLKNGTSAEKKKATDLGCDFLVFGHGLLEGFYADTGAVNAVAIMIPKDENAVLKPDQSLHGFLSKRFFLDEDLGSFPTAFLEK